MASVEAIKRPKGAKKILTNDTSLDSKQARKGQPGEASQARATKGSEPTGLSAQAQEHAATTGKNPKAEGSALMQDTGVELVTRDGGTAGRYADATGTKTGEDGRVTYGRHQLASGNNPRVVDAYRDAEGGAPAKKGRGAI